MESVDLPRVGKACVVALAVMGVKAPQGQPRKTASNSTSKVILEVYILMM